MGYQKIANELNANGIHAPSLPEWKNGTVKSILTNPIYMGYIAYNRRVGHSKTTRLDRKDWIYAKEQRKDLTVISPEMWERAQEIREARKNRIAASHAATMEKYQELYNVPFSTRGKLALTGLVYCGYCGKRLKNTGYANHWTSKKTGEEKVSYVGRYGCDNQCKPRSNYSQNYLESIVFDTVETYLENLKTVDLGAEVKEMQSQQEKGILSEIKGIEKEIKKMILDIETLESKIPDAIRGEFVFSVEKLAEKIQENNDRIKEREEKKKELQAQLSSVRAHNSDLEALVEIAPKWKELFREADVPAKKMLLSTLVDKIIVKEDEINIKFKISLEDFGGKKLLESGGFAVPQSWL